MSTFLRSITITAIAILLVFPADGCLWDSDTLRAEARGLPGIAEIITGRFERNPPLYYQMRLERAAKSLDANPRDWEAYDDAGVACDRLGRDDEAIQWMERKTAAMDAAGGGDAAITNHRYRALANLGTFHAHRWFAHGGRRDDMADMTRAAELVAAAIELNPEAHFGRERYQLMAIRWILDPTSMDPSLGSILELPVLFEADTRFKALVDGRGWRVTGNLKEAGLDDATKGLSGLIALGSAWESVDVFHALAFALSDESDAALSHLATLRCIELIQSGKASLHPAAPTGEALVNSIQLHGFQSTEESDVDAYYPKARAAADAWQANRTQFMLGRLQARRHPDTDASFWDGYVEVAPEALPDGLLGFGREQVRSILYPAGAIAIAIGLGVAIMWLMRRARSAQHAAGGVA